MLEKQRDCIDDDQMVEAILTDLFKASYCINHDLLIAKLGMVLAMNISFLKLFDISETKNQDQSYLQLLLRCNSGIPQGTILGLLHFSIDICDMFLLNRYFEIASYADDNTPYINEPTKDLVKTE